MNRFSKANRLLREQNYEEAISIYKDLIKDNPSFSEYYKNIAYAFKQLGKSSEANFYLSKLSQNEKNCINLENIYKKVSLLIYVNSIEHAISLQNQVNLLEEQTYKFYEILVIDDSCNNSVFDKIVQAAQFTKKIRAFKLPSYMGMAWAFNYALIKADGEIICFSNLNIIHKNSIQEKVIQLANSDIPVSVEFDFRDNKEHIWLNSLVFYKTPILSSIGFFDKVIFPVFLEEYYYRIYSYFTNTENINNNFNNKKKLVKDLQKELLNNTNNVLTAYRLSYRKWHQDYKEGAISNLFVPFEGARKFWCPNQLLIRAYISQKNDIKNLNIFWNQSLSRLRKTKLNPLVSKESSNKFQISIFRDFIKSNEIKIFKFSLDDPSVDCRLYQASDQFYYDIEPLPNYLFVDSYYWLRFFYIDERLFNPKIVSLERFSSQTQTFIHKGYRTENIKETLVSIILVTHNQQKTVRASIESILDQSYQNLELIIVDNNSTDNTVDIIRWMACKDIRIKPYYQIYTRESCWCINFGITKCSGDIITFHDGNSISSIQRIAIQVAELRYDISVLAVLGKSIHYNQQVEPLIEDNKLEKNSLETLAFKKVILSQIGYFYSIKNLVNLIQDKFGQKTIKFVSNTFSFICYFSCQNHFGYIKAKNSLPKNSRKNVLPTTTPENNFQKLFSGVTNKLLDRNEYITASMASIPSRKNFLKRVVNRILPQVNRLNVFLNGYHEIPSFLKHPKIQVATSKEYGDLRDNGKFFFLNSLKSGYHLTIDDDIEYPEDYVFQSILTSKKYGDKAIIGVHGVLLADPLKRFYQGRTVYHFKKTLKVDRFVHLLGTGTVTYHTSLLNISLDDFEVSGMADLWFALAARKQGIPMICQSHDKDWLIPMDNSDLPSGLFSEFRKKDQRQTQVAKSVGSWNFSNYQPIHTPLAKNLLANKTRKQLRLSQVNVEYIDRVLETPKVHFSIICCGWNCEKEAEACIQSILNQENGSYKMDIYIYEDGSTDNTRQVLRKYENNNNFYMIYSDYNRGPAFARYELLKQVTNPQSICVILDLDDYLISNALKIISQVYLDRPETLATYGNWNDQNGQSNPQEPYPIEVIQNKDYRSWKRFECCHLRTFRKFLSENITPSDLKDMSGNWLQACSDVALMFPILEQCNQNTLKFVPENLYIYNRKRTLGTQARFKTFKSLLYEYICSQPKKIRYSF